MKRLETYIMGNEPDKNTNTRGVGGMFGVSSGLILLTVIHYFSGLPGWVYFLLLLPVIYLSAIFGNWLQERKND